MRGSIRRRGKHSWQIRYYVPGREKPIEETVKGLKRQAEELLTERLAAIGQGDHVDPTKQSLGEFLDAWIAVKRGSPTMLDGYRIIINKHLKLELGHIPIQSLNFEHLEKYYQKKRKQPLSEQTIKHHHDLLRKVLKDAHRKKLVKTVETEFVSDDAKPSPEQSNIHSIDAADNKELLGLFSGQLRAMVLIALATGMRRGELCGLQWDPLEGDVIDVKRTLVRDGKALILKSPKTKKSTRKITLPSQAVTEMNAQRARQAQEKLKTGDLYHDKRFVFASPLGEAMSPDVLSHSFKARVKGTQFNDLTLHGLRHSHASQLIKDNINIKTICERLGHSTIKITLDTYGHLLPGMDQAAADSIGKTLG